MHTDEDRNPELDARLAALRAAMAPLNAPRGVEKELLDAFARKFAPRRWYHALSPAQWGAGGAASMALLALLIAMRTPAPVIPAGSDDDSAFIALESAERIAEEADPQLLETLVPRTALAALGVPVDPENAGDSVRAQLLVGADGSPLALRLVSLP